MRVHVSAGAVFLAFQQPVPIICSECLFLLQLTVFRACGKLHGDGSAAGRRDGRSWEFGGGRGDCHRQPCDGLGCGWTKEARSRRRAATEQRRIGVETCKFGVKGFRRALRRTLVRVLVGQCRIWKITALSSSAAGRYRACKSALGTV